MRRGALTLYEKQACDAPRICLLFFGHIAVKKTESQSIRVHFAPSSFVFEQTKRNQGAFTLPKANLLCQLTALWHRVVLARVRQLGAF